MEKELGVTEARKALSDLVEKVQYQGDTFILSRHGKPAAAIVPVQVYENWKQNRDAFFDLIRDLQGEADLEPDEAEALAAEAVLAVRGKSKKQP
jgi:prevent-host-death family protein